MVNSMSGDWIQSHVDPIAIGFASLRKESARGTGNDQSVLIPTESSKKHGAPGEPWSGASRHHAVRFILIVKQRPDGSRELSRHKRLLDMWQARGFHRRQPVVRVSRHSEHRNPRKKSAKLIGQIRSTEARHDHVKRWIGPEYCLADAIASTPLAACSTL